MSGRKGRHLAPGGRRGACTTNTTIMQTGPSAHHSPIGLFQRTCGLVLHGAALGASGPSPGRTTRRRLVVSRSSDGSRHGARWGWQVPAAALVPAALAAAGHGEAEHQDEQDRGDDKQDAPQGPPPCPWSPSLYRRTRSTPNYSPYPPSAGDSLALPGAEVRYGHGAVDGIAFERSSPIALTGHLVRHRRIGPGPSSDQEWK